ncbi:uncharacterized protein I206_105986 [Kwoniella pini CBS 10737]|uniref:Uncharacterized protein n=1 Tax=Kwoniella pini CBS 10737 TaxID=1296096 RepID=A0A1B9I0Q0_9TREE|nr:uncharacterized protein I206_04809 [Kwoniella pini CBS 10737]OCF49122.1 hypothetical protein I206_04809 [Kwoniella pini CBS 10737]
MPRVLIFPSRQDWTEQNAIDTMRSFFPENEASIETKGKTSGDYLAVTRKIDETRNFGMFPKSEFNEDMFRQFNKDVGNETQTSDTIKGDFDAINKILRELRTKVDSLQVLSSDLNSENDDLFLRLQSRKQKVEIVKVEDIDEGLDPCEISRGVMCVCRTAEENCSPCRIASTVCGSLSVAVVVGVLASGYAVTQASV